VDGELGVVRGRRRGGGWRISESSRAGNESGRFDKQIAGIHKEPRRSVQVWKGALVLRTLLARLVGLNHRRGRTALSLFYRDEFARFGVSSPLVLVLAHWISPLKEPSDWVAHPESTERTSCL